MPRFKTLGGRFELGSITNDAALDRAFRLAHSIYRCRASEREIALDILRESLRGVEVRLVGQDEADRHRPLRPSKVRWGAAQWRQLLIHYNSERHETRQEAAGGGSLDEEDRHRPLRPSKVRWGAAQWLQLLIYYNSERHETRQEAGGGRLLGHGAFGIRYIQ